MRRFDKTIVATEAAECGLACLAMVACTNGIETNLTDLRKDFPSSLTGLTARDLLEVGRRRGLQGRAFRADLDALREFELPLILHWDFNHFVVLRKCRTGFFIVDDPSSGRRKYSKEEVSRRFTGVVIQFVRDHSNSLDETHSPDRTTRAQIWRNVPGVRGAILQCVIVSALANIAALFIPLQSQIFIDFATSGVTTSTIPVLFFVFFLLLILATSLEWIRAWFVQYATTKISVIVVGRAVSHLLHLPLDYFIRRHTGDITSRVQSAKYIQDISPGIIASIIFDVPIAIVSITIIAIYSPILMSVVLVFTAAWAIISVLMSSQVKRLSEMHVAAQAKENTNLIETLRGMTTVKGMASEDQRENSWRNLYGISVARQLDAFSANLNIRILGQLISGLQALSVLALGAWLVVIGNTLTVGMLVATLAYRQIFGASATNLVSQILQYRIAKMHYERVGDILGTAADSKTDGSPAWDVKGAISLRDVRFRYGQFDPDVLKGLNLEIKAGEMVAIVGASGQGKSTLMSVMLGLLAPQSGEVHWDGVTASPATARFWRRSVGIVAQNDMLLAGSIADNIASFEPDLDMDKVVAAAGAAAIHDDIAKLPMQYRSLVGDLGSALSAGQKQRLMIARALYRTPKIIILDEGTANLDRENEELICRTVRAWSITRIVVSHRPALVDCADRVLVMSDGQISNVSR